MSLFKPSQGTDAERLQAFVASTPNPSWMSATDLNAARAADPSFDTDAFLAAAITLFRDVRSAYSDGNLDKVTGRIAPELAAIFDRQSRFLTTERTMSAIDTVTAELHGLDMASDGELRAVVRFDVTGRLGAVALNADVATATQLAGLPTRRWFEIWRLSRPCGFSTPPPATNCPSCGAPATGESHCHYCNALLVDATANFTVDAIECMG